MTEADPIPDAITPSSRARLLGWFGVALLTVYLVFIGGGWAGIYAAGIRMASTILIGIVIVIWALVAWRAPFWRPRSAVWPALSAALVAFAFATLTSRVPRMSVEYLAYAVILTTLYLLLQRLLADPFTRTRLAWLVVILGFAITTLYVGVVIASWIEWWGLVGHLARPPLRPEFASLTYGNPSAVLTMAVLLLSASLGFVGLASRRHRLLIASLGVLTLLVVLLSGSRAGWLALGLAIPVVGLLWLVSGEGRAWLRGAARSRRWIAGISAAGVAAATLAIVFLPGVLVRATAGGEDLRATYYATALRMFGDSPIVGTGPGSWVVQRIAFTHAGEPDYYIPHAHNVYLQTLAESGIVGAAAGVIVIAVVGSLVVAVIRSGDRLRRRVGWAALFSLVYLSAHHLLDFYPNMPAVLFVLALPVAWLDGTSTGSVTGWRSPSWLTKAGGIFLFVAAFASVAFLAWSELHAGPMAEATAAANDGDWTAAVEAATPAVQADPRIPAYVAMLALAEANTGDHPAAADLFRRAAEADDLPQSWLNLAAEEEQLGRADAARAALDRALRLGGQQEIVNLGASDLLLRMGDDSVADDLIVDAILLTPSLAGDPTLPSRPDLAPRWPAIIDRAIGRAPPAEAWEIALVAGRPEEAGELAAELDEEPRDIATHVIDAWTGDRDAYARLQALAEQSPLDPTLVSWCARIANRLGLEDDLDRYGRWIGILNAGTTGELRVVDAATALGSRAGSLAPFYGHYTYRRPTPWDLIVASLPHLVVE